MEYALRDVATLTAKAAAAGPAVGVYATRLLEVPLPWTRMRTVYRLLGLVRSYGAGPVDEACVRALELDVVDVGKIARMLEQAVEGAPVAVAVSAKVAGGGPARFARDAGEFAASSTPAGPGPHERAHSSGTRCRCGAESLAAQGEAWSLSGHAPGAARASTDRIAAARGLPHPAAL